jgi:hypothetical protein
MQTSTSTPTPKPVESTEELCKKLELEGEQKVEDLFKEKNISEESLMQIINEGNDEFKNAVGRNMTYSEMRSIYG